MEGTILKYGSADQHQEYEISLYKSGDMNDAPGPTKKKITGSQFFSPLFQVSFVENY